MAVDGAWPERIGTKYQMSEASAQQLFKTGVGWIDCAERLHKSGCTPGVGLFL
ncbi:hypothetical protein TCK1_4665 [Pseudomonas monteilii]|uniref:Uncharacterized protein n=1 Tax=Pseudomonas monteilii TaxID=76759 RepID=A0AAE6RFK5_9PSED|nr:hypothetical protein TCK1_4665 [Pseudomonas monteilii]